MPTAARRNSSISNPRFKSYFAKLPGVLKKYDSSVYLAEDYRDINFAKKHRVKNVRLIPNGADENEFKQLKDETGFRQRFKVKSFFILTIGTHTGSKGHAETLEVFKSLPFAATLVIIGNNPGWKEEGCFAKCQKSAEEINQSYHNKQVLLLDINRQDTLAALKSADLFLLLSNIETSPLVLFESAAAALPFVSSAAGNSAEIAKWTKGGKITKTVPYPGRKYDDVTVDIDAAKNLITRLRFNPIVRKRLGKSGRKNWEAKFTWQKITEQYLKLYEGKS